MLQTAPSLSVFNVTEEEKKKSDGEESSLRRTATIGDSIADAAGVDFSFENGMPSHAMNC